MIRRPPRSTRTDTLFPYTTLFRSGQFGKIRHILLNPSETCSDIVETSRATFIGGAGESVVFPFDRSYRLKDEAQGQLLSAQRIDPTWGCRLCHEAAPQGLQDRRGCHHGCARLTKPLNCQNAVEGKSVSVRVDSDVR